MRRIITIIALVLFIVGALALFLTPIVWQPEPLLTFQVGIGAGIFSILFGLAVLLILLANAVEWGKKQAAEKITRERDESHRQFLQRLDHELKNPLTGLKAALTNLREAQSAADTVAAVENASQAASRFKRILKDLRKLADLDAQLLEHRPVNLGELVEEMVEAAEELPAYQGRDIHLMISKVPALQLVMGDRDMLGLAVYNLLDNALKYSSTADAVEVRVREDGRVVFIEVADGGAGIPLQEQERIFEDLYRGDNAREIEGSGLGLALARRIIQLHGGVISLRSDPNQGRGTIFAIQLPMG